MFNRFFQICQLLDVFHCAYVMQTTQIQHFHPQKKRQQTKSCACWKFQIYSLRSSDPNFANHLHQGLFHLSAACTTSATPTPARRFTQKNRGKKTRGICRFFWTQKKKVTKLSRQGTPNSVKTKCNVYVTTLCEHSTCDHSMGALYVWPL